MRDLCLPPPPFSLLSEKLPASIPCPRPGCGALSSSCAQLATYPLALAKTRLQAKGMPGYTPSFDGSLGGCLLWTYRHEGVRGLYRGIVPNLLKAVPSISISYVVFENVKEALLVRGWSQPYHR